jgi:hypothetical protein
MDTTHTYQLLGIVSLIMSVVLWPDNPRSLFGSIVWNAIAIMYLILALLS